MGAALSNDEIDAWKNVFGPQEDERGIPEGQFDDGMKMNFEGIIAERFESDVISRQIPGYDDMRLRTLHACAHFVKPGTQVADIGTSNGRLLQDIIMAMVERESLRLSDVSYVGLDLSQDMLDVAQQNIDTLKAHPRVALAAKSGRVKAIARHQDQNPPHVELINHDLRSGLHRSVRDASVIASIFTLQFIPVERRPRLLRDIYEALVPGGALILGEKVMESDPDIEDFQNTLYLSEKERNGIPHDDILAKRSSIENYLIPLTDQGNRELLSAAGFSPHKVSVFWKSINFQAYVAVK